jgi:GDP-L-fucose synthase
MTHLYSSLERFNPRKISKFTGKRVKAFSFFGTVAKNYLAQLSIKYDKNKPNGTPRKLLDVSIAKKHGWFSRTSLYNGFFKTYQHYLLNN